MATVLVVDDVAANREIVSMLLSGRGHDVIEARDGAEGLALAHSRHPDVVVSDVLMPGIDGLELVHRLRSEPDPHAASAPVVFYTANYLEPETRPIAEACGVSQVVLRSADPNELVNAIESALRLGPIEIRPEPADEFARAHMVALKATLVEKVRELHHTEQRFEAMATSSPLGIVLLDAEGDAQYVNPRLTEITHMPTDELLGAGWLGCLDEGSRASALGVVRRVGGAVEHRYRSRITRPDGGTRWLRVHLRSVRDDDPDVSGAVVMIDDISDVVEAEERASREAMRRQEETRERDAERLESLRRMAGGVAHDFNNLLGTMLGFVGLAAEAIADEVAAGRMAAGAGNALLEDLGQVTKGGERASKLTEHLLAFGRREVNQPAVLDLAAYIREAAGALAEAAGSSVRLDLRLAEATPPVTIDPRLLGRVLHILVRNASEAMPDGGMVTIATGRDGETAAGSATVAITDSGCGMAPEVLERAFEPFFSTKPGNRTGGLGLSTAQGVISQAGGTLTLDSWAGAGTTATVRLPAAGVAVPAPTAPAGPLPAASDGGETVLLVDDDDDLRQVTARFITKSGYRVLTAAGGQEALDLAERHPDRIDCLVTDVVMPEMDGRQLAQRFRALRPDTKVVYISGYAEALIDDEGRSLEPGATIVPKPFTSADLQRALQVALASR